ncbi:polysaccharide biosynthesis tyrosine autokinase [Novosphingobium sp.]|uniref:GumC family protein n=1 Tax=Novosphingobium sp. TaxID=1874826 RepID=UPI00286E3276|nr:polysaccharide biosynthesis tyrosine autokinase [Novosphingobium sp.]
MKQDLASVLDWMSEGEGSSVDEKRTTLVDVKAMAWRQRRYLLTMVLVALQIGLISVFLMTPKFQATSSVRIDNETIQVIKGDDVNPIVSSFDTDRFLNAQKGVFLSRTMAYKVIDRLKLDQNHTFLQRMEASAPSDTLSPRAATLARREAAASLLQANLKMDIPAVDKIAIIKFTAPDPQLAQLVANAYADTFIENNITSRYNATSYARGVLAQQVQEAEAKLKATDTEAVDYARRNRLIDAGGVTTTSNDDTAASSGGSIKTTSLGQVNMALGEARKARILAEQRWRNSQTGSALSLPDARQNGFIQSLLSQRATTAAELNQLKQTYLDDHPSVVQAKGRLVEIEAQLKLATNNMRGALRNDYEIALNQERQLANAVESSSVDTLAEQDKRVQYNQLLRNAQSQRYRLLELERRLGEVNSLSDIATNNVSLVDYAMRPEGAVSPNLLRSLALALAVGLIIGLGLGILREVIDDTLWSPDDAEAKLRRPLLGTTPAVKEFTAAEVLSGHGDVSEAYFAVRTAVDYATKGNVRKILQVTSCQPGEGKSTTSVALAADFARVGRRVLLIDCDLRRPSIHRQLEIPNKTGLMDVLTGDAKLADVVQKFGPENLHVLTLGPKPSNPVQILSGEIFQNFVASAAKDYDVVIIDSPPVMGMADAQLIARTADATVLIIEAGRSHFGQAKLAVRKVEEAGTKVIGVVMTKFNYRDAGYNYDYRYGYYGYDESPA